MANNTDVAIQVKYAELKEQLSDVMEAVRELLEVAELRGDNELPPPGDDPKPWTGRMQEAWDDLAEIAEQIAAAPVEDWSA